MTRALLFDDVARGLRHCTRCNVEIKKGEFCTKIYSFSFCDECFLEALALLSKRNIERDIFKDEYIAKALTKFV